MLRLFFFFVCCNFEHDLKSFPRVDDEDILQLPQKAISCRKTADLIMNLLYNQSFVLFAGGKASKSYKLKNGAAQGSILAHALHHLYLRFPINFLQKIYVCWRRSTNIVLTNKSPWSSTPILKTWTAWANSIENGIWNFPQQNQFFPIFFWEINLLSTSYKYTCLVILFHLTLHLGTLVSLSIGR